MHEPTEECPTCEGRGKVRNRFGGSWVCWTCDGEGRIPIAHEEDDLEDAAEVLDKVSSNYGDWRGCV